MKTEGVPSGVAHLLDSVRRVNSDEERCCKERRVKPSELGSGCIQTFKECGVTATPPQLNLILTNFLAFASGVG